MSSIYLSLVWKIYVHCSFFVLFSLKKSQVKSRPIKLGKLDAYLILEISTQNWSLNAHTWCVLLWIYQNHLCLSILNITNHLCLSILNNFYFQQMFAAVDCKDLYWLNMLFSAATRWTVVAHTQRWAHQHRQKFKTMFKVIFKFTWYLLLFISSELTVEEYGSQDQLLCFIYFSLFYPIRFIFFLKGPIHFIL